MRTKNKIAGLQLPSEQLMEVLASAHRADLFIGGVVDQSSGTLTLTRGDLTTWIVPLSMFPAVGPSKPDFGRFAVDDYGYAIRFGDFETSAHPLLYKIDPEYRSRANKRRIAEEKGFGPALRRLQTFGDFPETTFPEFRQRRLPALSAARPRSLTEEHWIRSPRCLASHPRRSRLIDRSIQEEFQGSFQYSPEARCPRGPATCILVFDRRAALQVIDKLFESLNQASFNAVQFRLVD